MSDICFKNVGYFFFDGCGDAGVRTVDVGRATGVAGDGDACGVAAGDGCGACTGNPDCRTELVPVIAGSERHNANRKKPAAAPIVILANNVAVPRGPKAVLETELENNAPASDFPGWSRIVTTRMMHARIKSP